MPTVRFLPRGDTPESGQAPAVRTPWKPLPACTECQSVGCHSPHCSVGDAKRKAMDAPRVDKMVHKATVKK